MRWAVLLLLLFGCPSTDEPAGPGPTPTPSPPGAEFAWWCPADAVDVEARVDALLAEMTLEEKILQMSGEDTVSDAGFWPTPGVERLGLPGFHMVDGPRGVSAEVGAATAFPVGMARGATWDLDLERRVGRAMGLETRALGGDVLLAPTVNILRHPRWGRAQETYGEDPLHVGLFGAAFIDGAQETVLASVKHFAANSIENSRFVVDVQIDERALHEVYLRAFEPAVRVAGVGTVMSAYNSVNGSFCSQNEPLLDDVLREQWGFPGVVESDWFLGTHETLPSLDAGLDIEMPFAVIYGEELRALGATVEDRIDRAVRRIVRTQLCFGLDDPVDVEPSVVESDEHKALAREVAERAAVLLKNDGLLPLEGAGTLAVLGPLAEAENIGDTGSSNVAPSHVVDVLKGLLAAPGGWTVLGPGADPGDVDVAVVVIGLTSADEGEFLASHGDRDRLGLSDEDEALILDVASAAPATVVVLEGGSAITVEPWLDAVGAVLHAWYPGDQGGHAVADLLLGRVAPAGRLPLSVPVDEDDLPSFDNGSDVVTYDLWHGHRHLLRTGTAARFPFGFGLSTTAFDWGAPSLDDRGDVVVVSVWVDNVGARAGRETVQIYAEPPAGSLERAPRELVGWGQVALEPGESATVDVDVPWDRLAVWSDGWTVPVGEYRLVAARHAEDPGEGATLTRQ